MYGDISVEAVVVLWKSDAPEWRKRQTKEMSAPFVAVSVEEWSSASASRLGVDPAQGTSGSLPDC